MNALTIYGEAGRAVMKPLHFSGEMSATRISVTRSIPVLPIVYNSSPIVGFSTGQQSCTMWYNLWLNIPAASALTFWAEATTMKPRT